MLFIKTLGKLYCCPLKSNRLVDDSAGALKYRHVDSLAWSQAELAQGKIIKIREFPKEHKAKLFRVAVSNNRTDWVVTNDLAQDSTNATQGACGIRWKIEQFHRELKQLTSVEKCQCRKARIQNPESREIILPALSWCGFAWRSLREKHSRIYTA